MSGFNRRQIVWQLRQNERADKFIREKLPVGVFVGHQPPSQKPVAPLAGSSTPALPLEPFIHGWYRAFFQSARQQLPHLAFQEHAVLWRQGPHSKGECRLNEKKNHLFPG